MQSVTQLLSSTLSTTIKRLLACVVAFWLCAEICAFAQQAQIPTFSMSGLPYMNAGADSAMEQIDFAEAYLETQNKHAKEIEKLKAENKERVDSGTISALDLDAPNKAVEEYNRGTTLLKAQNSKEAIRCLQKAIGDYPKFVAAHVGLGLAYVDQEDPVQAKSEFEAAAKLDEKFPGSFVHLGQLALSQKDFDGAQSALEKAAAIRPKDTGILTILAYAQNGTHQYQQAIETAQRVHALDHKGMANIHYVAAAAAMSLNDSDTMERELNFFVSEDPTNAFAPAARQNLAALAHNRMVRAAAANGSQQNPTMVASLHTETFPNSERLKTQLNALGNESDGGPCEGCGVPVEATPAEANAATEVANGGAALDVAPHLSSQPSGLYTIRKNVDDVALFFSVSSHGHMISDLQASDIQIRDDNKPPVKVVQFAPQSKLPLRLGLLIDTSGSVHDRFSFEKHAATEFVRKMLSGKSDLAFVTGFSEVAVVTQDFTADPAELGKGIDKLANKGGTALFDAVSSACWKLAAYPDGERVARVLVILTDGEDNSSHGTLKQSIQAAEKTGVTIYTVSTREDSGDKTDADRVLEALAERSGGEAMFPGDILTLGRSFDKLRDLIRSRYFIAYKPADFQPNGKYRTISIVAEKDGKRLQVRARQGYHTRLEAGPK